jgi:hypothetical protein
MASHGIQHMIGQAIPWMFGVALLCMLAAIITTSIRAVIMTLQGKNPFMELAAEQEEKKEALKKFIAGRREPGRDSKPATSKAASRDADEPVGAAGVFTAAATAADVSELDSSDFEQEERPDVSQRTSAEAPDLESRLAAEFDADTVQANA